MSKPVKRPMTEAQKKARLANLSKARQRRGEEAKRKKENNGYEYNLNSDDSSDESDSGSDSSSSKGAFVISRAKPVKKQAKPVKNKSSKLSTQNKQERVNEDQISKYEFDQLKNIVGDIANELKKHNKKVNKITRKTKKSGGDKIVVLGSAQPQPQQQQPAQSNPAPQHNAAYAAYLNGLKTSLFD